MVLGGWIYTLLRQETRPSKGHESTQFSTLPLVVRVVYVRSSMLH